MYSIDAAQLLIHIHRVQQRLIKARLELVRDDQDTILMLLERLCCLRLREAVHMRLGIVNTAVLNCARKGNQCFVGIALLFQITLYCLFVAHGMQDANGSRSSLWPCRQ